MSQYASTFQRRVRVRGRWRARQRSFLIGFLVALAACWFGLYEATGPLARVLAYSVFRLERGSALGDAVAFFFYDAPRILLLIAFATFMLTLTQESVRHDRVVNLLRRRPRVANLVAAGFGVITPFCSCSAVPIFMSFIRTGVPFSAAMAFLSAAPLVNEIALVLLFVLFGWKLALLYLISGLTIAIVGGSAVARLGGERFVEPLPSTSCCSKTAPLAASGIALPASRMQRHAHLANAARASRDIIVKVAPYVAAGIAVAAAMHNRLGGHFVHSLIGSTHWWTVPAVALLGIPLYSNAAVFPIARELLNQGIELGTVLAFMMAVVGLSLPELIILRRMLKVRLIALFVGVVAGGIIFTGYLFNWLGHVATIVR